MTERLFSQRSFTSFGIFFLGPYSLARKRATRTESSCRNSPTRPSLKNNTSKRDHQIHQLVLHLVSFVSVGETPYCHGQSGVSCKIYFVECILKFFENYSIRLRSQNTQDSKIAHGSGHLE